MWLNLLARQAQRAPTRRFVALLGAACVVAALCCLLSPGWRADGAEAGGQDLTTVTADITRALERLPYRSRQYGEALMAEALGSLRNLGVEGLTPHQSSLLVGTVESMAQSPPSSEAETEYGKAWMCCLTERLVHRPITEEETAAVLAQCRSLEDSLYSVALELRPDDAERFRERSLAPMCAAYAQSAQTLMGGGPMGPLSSEDFAGVVALFRESLGAKAQTAKSPPRPDVAMAKAGARFLQISTGVGNDDMTPRLRKAREGLVQALERESEMDSAAFSAKHYGSIMRDTMGPHIDHTAASAGALDALALWHELLRAAHGTAAQADAEVSVEFWRRGAPCSRARGTATWSADGGGTARAQMVTTGPGTTWLADVWDGLSLVMAAEGETVSLRNGTNTARAAALPAEAPPVAGYQDTDMPAEMAAQASAQRLFWGAILPLWQQGEPPPVDLSQLYAPGLAPLLWKSQPRATRAERAQEQVVLRDLSGQVVARLIGHGRADPGRAPGLPETIEIELAHRQVTGMLAMTVQGKGRKEVTSAMDLDVRSARLQFRSISGVVLLDEYKVFRADGTPLCIVSFSDVQVKAAQ